MDTYSQHGAGILASWIEDYWRKRGFKAIRAERYEIADGFWGVRSNMVNGWPPREVTQ